MCVVFGSIEREKIVLLIYKRLHLVVLEGTGGVRVYIRGATRSSVAWNESTACLTSESVVPFTVTRSGDAECCCPVWLAALEPSQPVATALSSACSHLRAQTKELRFSSERRTPLGSWKESVWIRSCVEIWFSSPICKNVRFHWLLVLFGLSA